MLTATQRGARAFSASRQGSGKVPGVQRPRCAHRSSTLICHAQQQSDGFMDNVKRIAKSIQGALPIVGLISRLTADEGGFDELAYPEYCRFVINKASDTFKTALVNLEKRYGKVANSRLILLMLWMAKTGTGLVPAKDVISASRRIRITQDMEIEIDRFSATRSSTLKKYSMMQAPAGKLTDSLNLAADSLCTLCIGLKDGEPVAEEDAAMLTDILQGAFPEVDRSVIQASLNGRPQRASALTASS